MEKQKNKIRFECDYAEGAHPAIFESLIHTNFEQTKGYGEDEHCDNARRLIRQLCGDESVDVHFLVGGTQTNITVISSILRPFQGVISADSGHINVHETGAIEATGHKILTLKGENGKITASQIDRLHLDHWEDYNHEHIVQPGMVYISNPTEKGSIYSKQELQEISKVCHSLKMPLFMDGARLGYGLMAEGNDLTLPDIAELCDVFYIGGTKVGALFGEAVVITNDDLKRDFRYIMKQRGAMLAKGRLLGIQFETLFRDGLYFKISKHAVSLALKIRDAFKAAGFDFYCNSPTNQQFPILSDDEYQIMIQKYAFEYWAEVDTSHYACRFCTSWVTREEDVDALIKDIKELKVKSQECRV
jgi:threonine aldolase